MNRLNIERRGPVKDLTIDDATRRHIHEHPARQIIDAAYTVIALVAGLLVLAALI